MSDETKYVRGQPPALRKIFDDIPVTPKKGETKMIFYFELQQGCGLAVAEDIEQARAELKAEHGWANFKSVREATKDDIAWVGSMGGYVPKEAK